MLIWSLNWLLYLIFLLFEHAKFQPLYFVIWGSFFFFLKNFTDNIYHFEGSHKFKILDIELWQSLLSLYCFYWDSHVKNFINNIFVFETHIWNFECRIMIKTYTLWIYCLLYYISIFCNSPVSSSSSDWTPIVYSRVCIRSFFNI